MFLYLTVIGFLIVFNSQVSNVTQTTTNDNRLSFFYCVRPRRRKSRFMFWLASLMSLEGVGRGD